MELLKTDFTYHIFNHANGFENLFLHEANYHYFLEKYAMYISPIAETYAYCLMPNHFHFVIRIRKQIIIEELIRIKDNKFENTISNVSNFGNGIQIRIDDDQITKFISKQFANLFSCYTQSFNKVYQRKGSLFIKNFKREMITDKDYFIKAVAYFHRNPVHHGFCKDFSEWPYSSFHEIVSGQTYIIETAILMKLFGSMDFLMEEHLKSLETFERKIDLEMN
jgi:putative transposase